MKRYVYEITTEEEKIEYVTYEADSIDEADNKIEKDQEMNHPFWKKYELYDVLEITVSVTNLRVFDK